MRLEVQTNRLQRPDRTGIMWATLNVVSVGVKRISSGIRPVLITEIGKEQLSFSSSLMLPVRSDYVIGLQMESNSRQVRFEGVVTSALKESQLYHYDVRLMLKTEEEKQALNRIIVQKQQQGLLSLQEVHGTYRRMVEIEDFSRLLPTLNLTR